MKYIILLFLIASTIFADKKNLLDSIEKLDFKIFNTEKRLLNIKESINNIQDVIKDNEIDLTDIQEKKAIIRKKLNKRLKFLFKISNSDLSFFSESKNILEIEQKERFIKTITSKDLILLKKHHKIIEKEKKIILENRKSLLFLEKEEKTLRKEKLLLETERKNKRKELKKIFQSKKLKEKLYKEKRKESNKISQKHKKVVKKSNFLSLKGKFRLPVKAKVAKKYFVKRRKRSFVVHKGFTFNIPVGTQVHSIYKGDIVFSGYIKGFGKTIIIAHGDSYYSLYMHLNQILKRRGSKVLENELIALSGESGGAERPKLYFEIRHKKNPININKWFLK